MGKVLCNGVCVDPNNDPNNCGKCANVCGKSLVCKVGICSCIAIAETNCNGQCTNTQLDPKNCGMCGNACGMNQTCVLGKCQ